MLELIFLCYVALTIFMSVFSLTHHLLELSHINSYNCSSISKVMFYLPLTCGRTSTSDRFFMGGATEEYLETFNSVDIISKLLLLEHTYTGRNICDGYAYISDYEYSLFDVIFLFVKLILTFPVLVVTFIHGYIADLYATKGVHLKFKINSKKDSLNDFYEDK